MKKLLIIAPILPYPSSSQVGIFYPIDYLRNKYDITFVCEECNENSFNQLSQLWPEVNIKVLRFKDLSPKKINFIHILKVIYYFVKRKKIQSGFELKSFVEGHYNTLGIIQPEFASYVDSIIKNNKFDIIQVELLPYISLINILPENVKKIFVQHEIGYKKIERILQANKQSSKYYDILLENFKSIELLLLNRYEKVIVFSDVDNKILSDGMEPNKLVTAPVPIELNESNINKPFNFKKKIVFIGMEGNYPNFDGVKWFLESIWDNLLNLDNNLSFFITGKWSNETKKKFSAKKNVIFTGFVNNLQEVLEGAILVVPLRIGGGIRVKIMEAINNNTPVLTTSIGVEGLLLEPKTDYLLANTELEFSNSISDILSNKIELDQMILHAKNRLQANYNIQSCSERRISIYENLLK